SGVDAGLLRHGTGGAMAERKPALARGPGEDLQGRRERLVLYRRAVVADEDLWHDADVRDVGARRRVVAGDRQLDCRTVAERVDRLNEGLPEGALADDRRAMVVSQRRRDDLGGARAVTVDEHHERQPRSDAADRTEDFTRLVQPDQRDDDAAIEKER